MQDQAVVVVLRSVSNNQGTLFRKNRLIETSTHNGQKIRVGKMPEKKVIKVIKKDERARKQKPAPKGNTTAQTAREMVQTVTNWVNELQQKRRVETAKAIELMLPENPRRRPPRSRRRTHRRQRS